MLAHAAGITRYVACVNQTRRSDKVLERMAYEATADEKLRCLWRQRHLLETAALLQVYPRSWREVSIAPPAARTMKLSTGISMAPSSNVKDSMYSSMQDVLMSATQTAVYIAKFNRALEPFPLASR